MKICNKCFLEKDNSEYYKDSSRKDGLQYTCKSCQAAIQKSRVLTDEQKLGRVHNALHWNKENKEKSTLHVASYKRRHPEKTKVVARKSWLKARYGITVDEYDEMFEVQHGKCLICDKHQSELSATLHVDHCHKTNTVRGLLCRECNVAIGLIKESPIVAKRMAIYLEHFT